MQVLNPLVSYKQVFTVQYMRKEARLLSSVSTVFFLHLSTVTPQLNTPFQSYHKIPLNLDTFTVNTHFTEILKTYHTEILNGKYECTLFNVILILNSVKENYYIPKE